MTKPLSVFLIAGEASGDVLGAGLMQALRRQLPRSRFAGMGGPAMTVQGLVPLFPIADIAVMGFVPVVARLPLLLRRIRETAAAAIRSDADVLVLIDSPDFTHRVARLVKRARPSLPIIGYVSPTVWAWRPGRARVMRRHFDHVLAILPFEPEALARLQGPPTTYVGHPLVERLDDLRGSGSAADAPLVVVLPGSRRSEVRRLMQPFGEALARVATRFPGARFALPTVPHLREEVERLAANWPVRAVISTDISEKFAAFRNARAALTKSGTVTLELALAQVPMVAAYRVAPVEAAIARRMVTVPSVILPNLVAGRSIVPELLQNDCTPEKLASALMAIIEDGPARTAQLAAFREVESAMLVKGNDPSARAAGVVMEIAARAGAAVGDARP